ncbi:MAG: aldo/keto reductase [Verrucomicrobiota bacterium]
MKFKELGATGQQVPEIGVGTYLYRGTAELLRLGVEQGATLIDTAEYYGNEEVVGQAIRGIRDRVFVATKAHHWRRQEVFDSADASLRKLGIETIDLYQIHWPNAAVPIEETMAAMEELVARGKVRFIGVSNFTLPELKRAQRALRKERIVSNQVRYSLIHRTIEPRLLPYCQAQQITVIAYSPLGHRYDALLEADGRGALRRVATETGKTVAQVALNWCVAKPGVVAIPKTESAAHLTENCRSSDWRLSAAQMKLLDEGVRYRSRSRGELALRRYVRGAVQIYRAKMRKVT